ncbi:MAG: hypothetical protein ACYDDV_00365 [Methanoregula sp.]
MSPCLWPEVQEAMDLLMNQTVTPENVTRARIFFEKVIAEAAPGSDELVAALYGAGVVHSLEGNFDKALPYLIAFGRLAL